MFTEGQKCPSCNDGLLSKIYVNRHVEYKGQSKDFPGYEFFCSHCAETFLTPELEAEYDDKLVSFFRDVDGLLQPSQVKAIRKFYKKTQREFALVLGVGEKNFARYENGTVAQSRAMDLLLRIMQKYPEVFYTIVANNRTLGFSSSEDSVVHVVHQVYTANNKTLQEKSFQSWEPPNTKGEQLVACQGWT